MLLSECAQCNGRSLCDADGSGARCLEPPCCFPEMRCNGAAVEICNADSTGFDTISLCATAALCFAEGGEAHCAIGCAPGEIRCSGSTLMRCNDGRTGYDTVEECATPAACDDVAGVCRSADAGAP